MNLTINIVLPNDRSKLGTFSLITADGEVLIDKSPCLGFADFAAAQVHNNPDRDPMKPYGNTPLGRYHTTVIPRAQNTYSYGTSKRFLLTPFSGPCVQAEADGRRGLEIHSGDENNNYPQWDYLRPTDGCVRLHQTALSQAIGLVDRYQPDELWTNITECL